MRRAMLSLKKALSAYNTNKEQLREQLEFKNPVGYNRSQGSQKYKYIFLLDFRFGCNLPLVLNYHILGKVSILCNIYNV